MPQQIEVSLEKMNHGNWLKIVVPYTGNTMTALLQNNLGETFRSVKLVTGNNLIDIESITSHSIHLKVDTPFETILKELKLE